MALPLHFAAMCSDMGSARSTEGRVVGDSTHLPHSLGAPQLRQQRDAWCSSRTIAARSIPKEYARRYNDEIMSYGLVYTQRSMKHATVLELSAGMEARGSCSLRGCGGANHGVVPCIIVPIDNRPTFHLTRPDLMTSQMLIE